MDLVGKLFPGLTARWYAKRAALAHYQRLYQAAQTSSLRPRRGDGRSANAVMEHARHRGTHWARYLEENSDLAIGVLDDLVDRVIGRGIVVEPLVRGPDGTPLEALNDDIRQKWEEWGRKPEVSQVVPFGELQRLCFRSTLRDGEVLSRMVRGVSGYQYPTMTPFALDCLEADYLPWDFTISTPVDVTHGVERDGFGTIIAYHIFRQHPGDFMVALSAERLGEQTVRVEASDVIHLRIARRLNQLRGITIFHGCVHRLQDLTDYEESERIAAKIAASFSVAITKSGDMASPVLNTAGDRTLEISPGMMFDGLLPGESVEVMDSKRPSNALPDYRRAMLQAVSAGTGARYSTIARTWDSSYTAMRQETVSMMPGTDRMQDYFVARWLRPVYETWLDTAIRARVLNVAGAAENTLSDADYIGPGQPWIDPDDEVKADVTAIANGLKSRPQAIRERGGDPRKVDAELQMDDFTPEPQQPAPTELELEDA